LFKDWKLMRVWPGGKDFRLFKAVILDGYWTNTLWRYPTWFLLKYPVSTNMPGSLNLNPNETKFIKIFTHLYILVLRKLMFMYSIYIVSTRTKMIKKGVVHKMGPHSKLIAQ
jgi:hypothetical protein